MLEHVDDAMAKVRTTHPRMRQECVRKRALLRVKREATREEVARLRCGLLRDLIGKADRAGHEHAFDAASRIGRIGQIELEDAHGHGPDIGTVGVRHLPNHLGRNPVRRTKHLHARTLAKVGTKTEVDELDLSLDAHHYIRTLQVAVNKLQRVQVLERHQNLVCNIGNMLVAETMGASSFG